MLFAKPLSGTSDAVFEFHLLAPHMHGVIDMHRHPPPHHRSHEAHEPAGLPEFSAVDGLRHDQKCVVDPVIQFMRAQRPAKLTQNLFLPEDIKPPP